MPRCEHSEADRLYAAGTGALELRLRRLLEELHAVTLAREEEAAAAPAVCEADDAYVRRQPEVALRRRAQRVAMLSQSALLRQLRARRCAKSQARSNKRERVREQHLSG